MKTIHEWMDVQNSQDWAIHSEASRRCSDRATFPHATCRPNACISVSGSLQRWAGCAEGSLPWLGQGECCGAAVLQQVSAVGQAPGPWHGGSAFTGLARMGKVEIINESQSWSCCKVMLSRLTACWLFSIQRKSKVLLACPVANSTFKFGQISLSYENIRFK